MRRAVTAVAAAAVLMVGTPTAHAEAKGVNVCTRAEFHKIHKGDRIKKVRRLCGRGHQEWFISGTRFSPAEQGRSYHGRSRYDTIEVDFKKKSGTWVVTSKFAFWL